MIRIKSDSEIQQEVLRELNWDTRVEETEIGVTVNNGIVTLTGIVNAYGKKIAAQEAAHRVAGVLDVANDIQVRIPDGLDHTDPEIAETVRKALEWSIWIPAERIRSTVSDGWVTLEGVVSHLGEREDAERAVRHLKGVRGVTNKILVNGPEVKPEEVRTMIEEALERRAEREARRIKVEIEDGRVTLSGAVRSWAEKRAVLGIVSHAPGVRAVDEELFIDPLI
ncbi:MAG TPA: BON domain-containing protein [Blastocatellia bacterium]|nr:BON domain-containing protein [Blastocatellia bacterium]